jgi:hypothetical protein
MLHTNYISPFRNPFESFWMAGFECTDKLNCFGDRVDFLSATGHLDKLEEDYKDVCQLDFKTVREGIRWSIVETSPFKYNWSDVEKILIAAKKHKIQVLWDICHFGFPTDLSPMHPTFAKRFAALCRAFVKFYRTLNPDETLIITPFNEVSFLAWLGGEVGGTSPFCIHYGIEVKYRIMRAFIEGVEAIKEEDANTRIMLTEPLVNMVPPLNATSEQVAFATKCNESQFEVFEILSGNMYPELRGKPEYVDIIGCNYYYNNQWLAGTTDFLPWVNGSGDPRWKPLSSLITGLYERYKRPLVMSETSHPKEDRPNWMKFIAEQCAIVLRQNIPLWGICWYPVIDRPDWDHPTQWHRSGIWDINNPDVDLTRTLHQPTAEAVRDAQRLLKEVTTAKMSNQSYEIS